MANFKKIETLTYTEQNDSDILEVANGLGELTNRTTHDATRILILEAGRAKIAELKGICQEDNLGNSDKKTVEAVNG